MVDSTKKQLDARALKGAHFTELGRMLSALLNALYCLDDGPSSPKNGYFGNIYQASSFKRGDREYEDPIYREARGFKDSGQLGCARIADLMHGPLRLFGSQVGKRFDFSSMPIIDEHKEKLDRCLEAYKLW